MSWRPWWGYNREELLDLRTLERAGATLTGRHAPGRRDPLGALRAETLEALRHVAMSRTETPEVRVQALLALGRAGGGTDLLDMLAILRDGSEDDRVREAATLALALLPPVEAPDAREATRRKLEWCILAADVPQQLREFGLIAAGLRARDDERIGLLLAVRCKGGLADWNEGAALALALGLSGDSLLLPEMLGATTRGELCGTTLHDAGRSHGIVALGHAGTPAALQALVGILQSRRVGADSRRSAALSIGRILRQGTAGAEDAKAAVRELVKQLDERRDPILKGYCAVALGAAKPPREIPRLQEALTERSDPILRGYAAIALGLAARELDDADRKPIRAQLAGEFARAKDGEQASALMVGLGLAGASEALPDLLARLERKGSTEPVRAAAAEALGLVGVPSAPVVQALREAALKGDVHVAPAAAEALAMLGDSASAVHVLEQLGPAANAHLHTHLTRAVGLAGDPAAAPMLLKLLRTEAAGDEARADAAMALGLLGNLRERDGLAGLAAWFNLDATTTVTLQILVASCGCRRATMP
jgi:HEAT repeat protein